LLGIQRAQFAFAEARKLGRIAQFRLLGQHAVNRQGQRHPVGSRLRAAPLMDAPGALHEVGSGRNPGGAG